MDAAKRFKETSGRFRKCVKQDISNLPDSGSDIHIWGVLQELGR